MPTPMKTALEAVVNMPSNVVPIFGMSRDEAKAHMAGHISLACLHLQQALQTALKHGLCDTATGAALNNTVEFMGKQTWTD